MKPFVTKSHLSVDMKNKVFLFYQKVMHSLAVTVTEVTKGSAFASVPFVTVTESQDGTRFQRYFHATPPTRSYRPRENARYLALYGVSKDGMGRETVRVVIQLNTGEHHECKQ